MPNCPFTEYHSRPHGCFIDIDYVKYRELFTMPYKACVVAFQKQCLCCGILYHVDLHNYSPRHYVLSLSEYITLRRNEVSNVLSYPVIA